MQAPDGLPGGAEGGEDGQEGPREIPHVQDGGAEIQEGAAAASPDFSSDDSEDEDFFRTLLLQNVGGPGRVALLVARSRDEDLLEMSLWVPMPSSRQAELLRRSLPPLQEYPDSQSDARVHGSFLRVTWVDGDPERIWSSFTSFFEHITSHLQTWRHFGHRLRHRCLHRH